MKKTLLIACGFLASAALVAPVSAQSYKWKDEKGQTHISDTPPPRAAKAQKTGGEEKALTRGTPADTKAASSEKPVTNDAKAPSSGPKTLAEKDMEFKKRQQEAKDKAEKAEKEREAEAERQRACESARQSLSTLQSGAPVGTIDEKGKQTIMNSAARQQEIERDQRFIEKNCSK